MYSMFRATERVYEHTKNYWLSIKNADVSTKTSDANLPDEHSLKPFRQRYSYTKFALLFLNRLNVFNVPYRCFMGFSIRI